MLKLAFRNIFRQRVRTLLTLGAIVIGVAAITLTGGFVEDIFVQLREATIHSQVGHIQITKSGYSSLGRRDPYAYLIADGPEMAEKLEASTRVEDAMLRLNFSGLASNGRADTPIIGQGVEPEKETRLGTSLTITAGRPLADSDTFGAMLGQGVARSLNLGPGDFINLLVTTPGGALNSLEFEVTSVFQSFSKDYDDRAVRIPLLTAQELLATEGTHTLVLALGETEWTEPTVDHLRTELTADEYEVRAWHEIAGFYRKTVDLYGRQFGVLQFIVLVLVLFGVGNSVNMTIHERSGEFGTLRALGKRNRDIFWLIILENGLLGVVGATTGVVLGVFLALAISEIGIPMPPPPNSNSGYTAYIRVVPSVLSLAFAVGVIGTVAASVLPARRVRQMPIVDALRRNV